MRAAPWRRWPLLLLLLLLGWRLLWAVGVVARTSFVPDEFWQADEVAHRLAFGWGELTWEWTVAAPVRSAIVPAVYAMPLALLRAAGLDSPGAVVASPRVLHALVGTAGDVLAHRVARNWFDDERVARWALLLHTTAWCVLYCWSRALSNTLEALLTLTALAFPTSRLGVACMALSAVIRPPGALTWVLWAVAVQPEPLGRWLVRAAPVATAVLVASALVDRWLFGVWTLPWLNFLLFNGSGAASHYGTHPWHWYASSGLPTLWGPYAPAVLVGVWSGRPRGPAALFLVALPLALSCIGHKEFRFLLPSLSVSLVYAARGIARFLAAGSRWRVVLVGASLVCNVGMAAYFGGVHQQGPIAASAYLRARLRPGQHVGMLVPCHSLPGHAHLHVPNVTLHHLRCDPHDVDESDAFFADPSLQRVRTTLEQRWHSPHWVVAFEPLDATLTKLAPRWQRVWQHFHAHAPSDSRHGHHVSVWQRSAR